MAKMVGSCRAFNARIGSPQTSLPMPSLDRPALDMPMLDFWFDFASTYSYPAATRISPLAAIAGVTIRFRPFLLGPIFKAQGWETSPFNLYPAKGRYMWRDLERLC